jgi:Flp pilus assembly CpaE family ATPase
MSGHFVEVWSPDLCTRCLGQGREKNLKYTITDEQELSMLQLKCVECHVITTMASAVGNELRKRLLKAEGRARSRVLALMIVGAFITLGATFIAANALAAR